MTFWVLIGVLTLAVAGPMAAALWRGPSGAGSADAATDAPDAAAEGDEGAQASSAAASDLAVYRDQLAEVDRDRARGVLGEEEAQRIRTEVSRRLLAADEAARRAKAPVRAPRALSRAAALLLVLALFGGGLALYLPMGAPGYGDLALSARIEAAEARHADRPSQSEAVASLREAAPDVAPQAPDPRFTDLMEKLRAALKERPDDLQGFRLLARNEAALGDHAAAQKAQERVISILGDEATAQDYADLADIMVQAAGGYVSPEAERALSAALARDRDNGVARYYSGLMMAQVGRPDRAFRIWRSLLSDSAPDDPWMTPLRAQLPGMADRAGVRFTLPEIDGDTAPSGRGPTEADIAAASEMSAEERQQMIRGMVDGLSQRLASQGGTPQDWARLISALGVLGETERARKIWEEARLVFAGDENALAEIAAGAERAGLGQ